MRFIGMKHFRSDEAKKKVIGFGETLVLGQIIGQVVATQEKENVNQTTGEVTKSTVLIGDFAGVCYETQAKFVAAGKPATDAELNSEQLYMPKWYAEVVRDKLKSNGDAPIEFAAEVIMFPTGASIPFGYDVRSMIARPATSAVERMKRALAKEGTLRLSPPVETDPAPIALERPSETAAPVQSPQDDDASEPTADDLAGRAEPGADAPKGKGKATAKAA